MLILKCETFQVAGSLTDFVNQNDIPRENIFSIVYKEGSLFSYTIFYYAEGVIEKKTEVEIEIKEKKGTWF